jgi:hypothetical protein
MANISVKRLENEDVKIEIRESKGHGAALTNRLTEIVIDYESIDTVIQLVESLRNFHKAAKVKEVKVTKTKAILPTETK